MKAKAEKLAKVYEVDDFFTYIEESWINGNKRQALRLFSEMNTNSRKDFLLSLIEPVDTENLLPWKKTFLKAIINNIVKLEFDG